MISRFKTAARTLLHRSLGSFFDLCDHAVKFLLLDDHPLFRQALKSITLRIDPGALVIECASYVQSLSHLGEDLDLVLLDLRMSGLDGMEVLANLRVQHPTLPVVVVSASQDRNEVISALRLGALGFVPKASSAEVIEHALRLVLSGDTYLPSHLLLSDDLPDNCQRETPLELTDRQKQVMQWMAQGESNKQIARRLNVAETTVKVHVTAILRELKVSSRAQAIVALFQRGKVYAP